MSSIGREGQVRVVSGNLGGGKTIWAVREALDKNVPFGAVVFSNIVFNESGVTKYLEGRKSVKYNPDQFVYLGDDIHHFADKLKQGTSKQPNLLLYDESQLEFTALGYKENRQAKKAEMELIAQARKLKLDVVFIAQDERDIDVYIRRRSQYFVECTNFQKHAIVGWFFRGLKIPMHRFFVCPVVRGEIPKNASVKTEFWLREKSIMEAYNTHELFGRFVGMEEQNFEVEKIKKKKWGKFMKLFLLLMVGLAVFSFFNIKKTFGNKGDVDNSGGVSVQPSSVGVGESLDVDSTVSSSPFYAGKLGLHVTGIIMAGPRSMVTLSDGRVLRFGDWDNLTPSFVDFESQRLWLIEPSRGVYPEFPDLPEREKPFYVEPFLYQ